MHLGSMFIWNCNIALHVSEAFCLHLQEFESCFIKLGTCHSPEAATTVSKCS